MPVSIFNNQRKVSFSKGMFDDAFNSALEISGHGSDLVEVSFVSNFAIARLNAEWRGKKGPTDCLSFPFPPDVVLPDQTGGRPLGDIVISLEQARAQGPVHTEILVPGHDEFFSETLFLFIHSMLHLIGYDHETGPEDAARMEAEQERIYSEVSVVIGGRDKIT